MRPRTGAWSIQSQVFKKLMGEENVTGDSMRRRVVCLHESDSHSISLQLTESARRGMHELRYTFAGIAPRSPRRKWPHVQCNIKARKLFKRVKRPIFFAKKIAMCMHISEIKYEATCSY